MKLLEKHKNLFLLSFISIISLIVILISFISINKLDKIKGDVSNFTPQANYNLSTTDKVDSSTWVAVDNLGRTVSTSGETYRNGVTNTNMTVGASINSSKQVGLFYHNWHNVVRHNMTIPETIPTRMSYISSLNKNPLLIQSWKDTRGNGHPGLGTYWWAEPVYGFYNPKDKYVIRKQIELISDAGVDFLVLDYTNYNTISAGDPYSTVIDNSMYPDELNILFQVLDEAKADGIKTPKVTFMLSHLACDRNKPSCSDHSQSIEYNNNTKVMVQWLFSNVYNNSSRQKHLLYGGGNLPIILAQHPSSTTWQPDSSYSHITEGSAHWRFMGNQYENAAYNTSGYDWSWIDKYPQTKYMYNTSTGTTNEITVSPAQHTDKDPSHGAIAFSFADTYGNDLLGRSNAVGDEYSYSYQYRGTTYNVGQSFQIVSGTGVGTLYGRNFQQQWDYAISTNPEFVMVTGWNEYLAGSFEDGNGKIMFVDQYNDEYSRDLEPVKGSLKDSYYYQLVSNIRRYKGANNQASQSTSKTINIYGDPNQWNDSNLIDYNSYTNNTAPERNVNNNQWGYNNNTKLTNVGVKNDIRTTKVSYDASNIYFYVETVNTISDISKLRLLIDTLPSKTNTSDKNWNEFEFVLNRNGKTADTLKLEKVSTGCRNVALPSENNGNCQWTSVGSVNYQVVSNTMQVSIPRSMLGLTSTNINFNYKWADNNMGNLEKTFDIMSVYTDGDAAPGGRFTYKFSGSKAYSSPTQYTITYNANGGTGTVPSQTGELNTKITLKANSFSNGAKTFKNWNTKANGTGVSYNPNETIIISGNMTLYAQWEVTKVTKPTLQGSSTFTYNGSAQGIIVNNVDTSKMNVSGYTSRTNAGSYQVTYSLKDKNGTSWPDGTTTDIVFNWSISKVKVEKPTISGSNSFTYNGNYQGLTFENLDTNLETVTGNEEIDVSSYTTTVSLKDTTNYSWRDNTVSAIVFTWYIEKANINAAVTMADYYENTTPSNPVVTGNLGSGDVTFSYTSKGTTSYSSNKPTKKGNYTVKAIIEPTANYNGQTVTSDFEVLASEPEAISLPEGSIVRDVGVYGALIDSFNKEKGTHLDYKHLFTTAELASLKSLSITPEEYHYVNVSNFDDLKYLTSLQSLNINLWEECSPTKLDLHTNLDLKLLSVKNAQLEIINISKLSLDSIDLDKPNNIGYLITDQGNDVSYIKNVNKTNQYLITTPETTTATGLLNTNYIINIEGDTAYEPGYYVVVLGDVKADGIIDIRDVAKAYDGLANYNYMAYTDAEKYALDMNNDNKKSILDLIKIYNAMN